jgi:hypothetical protein
MEYYGSSGILGLLPRSLTDTRMRDFTDGEFDVFLSLTSRLRPDLEVERTTTVTAESGVFLRMRIWGRIIDMSQAGLRPLKGDFDFIQKDTNIYCGCQELTVMWLLSQYSSQHCGVYTYILALVKFPPHLI